MVGVDDRVHPKSRCGVHGLRLLVVTLGDGVKKGLLLGFSGGFSLLLQGGLFNLQEHLRRLGAAHHRQACGGPCDDEPWVVCLAAHGVIPRAIAVAHHDGEFGDHAVGHRVDHLGAVLDDAAMFRFGPDHEAGDVLQEHQRHIALVAGHDETGGLVCAVGVNHPAKLKAVLLAFHHRALVGHNADAPPVDARIPTHQGFSVPGFVLGETVLVDERVKKVACVVRFRSGVGHDPANGRRSWRQGRVSLESCLGTQVAPVRGELSNVRQRLFFVGATVICHP